MAFTEDEEILQDFLIEAGEILEKLNGQLVELENSPDDNELLNAVFRGFHTIKGGASFLSLTGVVEICHRSEDVFNLLRNGERHVDAQLMDVILPVLDVLNNQFDALNSGNEPQSATPELLSDLDKIIHSDKTSTTATEEAVVLQKPDEIKEELSEGANGSTISQDNTETGDITDDEFEALLDNIENKKSPDVNPQVKPQVHTASDDIISDDDFEDLLDQLHAGGAPKGNEAKKINDPKKVEELESNVDSKPDVNSNKSEYISDQEFEVLLDTLHGPSTSSTVNASSKDTEKKNIEEAKPVKSEVQNIAKKDDEIAVTPSNTQTITPSNAPTISPKKETQTETTVRVDTSRLDDIMNLVGELVLVRNRMSTLEATYNDDELEKVVSNFNIVTTDLQTAVMKTRMQPIKKVFGRFPRVIRDLARSLKKKVNLELQGEETDLDKNLVEALADPLVHLVRNSVDHGIELPEVRTALGKSEHGTVILGAKQEGDHISLTIEDDGAGIDPEKLKNIAVSKGLMDEETAARLTESEAYNLIFMAGFSTKEVISDVSGRGVGMDVVKNSIAQLNGLIEIESQLGKGSKLTIKVPLTLAIMPTLMIKLATQVFALPLVNVGEILNLDLTKTNVVDGQLVIMIRDKALPIYYLKRWLVKGARSDELPQLGHVVIVAVGTQRVGFVVDQLVGQEEVVIKPLGSTLQGTPGLSGATITGDGKIALILDVPQLMTTYAGMS